MTTLIINIDKESSLKPLLDLVQKLHLKAKVMTTEKKEGDEEDQDWQNLFSQNLNKAYGVHEPDYDISMLKEPNPEYKP